MAGHLPPIARASLVFVNDGQGHASLEAMVAGLEVWAETFGASRAAFQVGYESDRSGRPLHTDTSL